MKRIAKLGATAALVAAVAAASSWGAGGDAANTASVASKAGAERSSDSDEDSGDFIDPLGPNAACYVCHMTFVTEEISSQHKAQDIGCIKCHGLSAGHANDEDIGATPPDITYERDKVDAACTACHETHDAPANKIVARFIERKLTDSSPVCTDCHGHHRIAEATAR